MACQIPLRSGLPSAVRGARYAAGACPDTGVATAAMNAPPAAAMAAMMTVLKVLRTWDTPPAGVNPRRILIDCQYVTVTRSPSTGARNHTADGSGRAAMANGRAGFSERAQRSPRLMR